MTYKLNTDKNGNQSLLLLAKLTRASDSYALSQRTVSFYETTDHQFSTDAVASSTVFLGTATTDATGLGTLVYITQLTGDHQFMAVFNGDTTAAFARVNTTLTITKLPANMAPLFPPTGMEKIDNLGEIAVGVVVLAVWALLIAVFFGTIRGIRNPSQA